MTNDELRALADALEPTAKAPRFEDFDVPAFCVWVRAQADAQPVAWIAHNLTTGHVKWTTDRCRARGWTRVANLRVRPLYPAPAAPQAEPQEENIVWKQIIPDDVPQAEPKREPLSEATALIEWPESAKWKNRAAPEGIERSCMGEPKREPSCLWSRADDDTDVWETKCGHAFTIIEGTPTDNSMAFCCYCGRPVDEEIGGSDAE